MGCEDCTFFVHDPGALYVECCAGISDDCPQEAEVAARAEALPLALCHDDRAVESCPHCGGNLESGFTYLFCGFGPTYNATWIYSNPSEHPRLLVLQHVVIRAVRALGKIEALALIRGAYARHDGAEATLEDARLIYDSIRAF